MSRNWTAGSGQRRISLCESEFHKGMTSVNIQLLADIITMGFDSTRTDEKFLCDLFAGFIFGKQCEHS